MMRQVKMKQQLLQPIWGLMILLVFMVSCDKEEVIIDPSANCTNGEGAQVTRTLSLDAFVAVELSMAANITVKQGDKQEVKAIGESNIIDLISTKVSNGMWTITTKDDVCISNYQLAFELTVPNVNKLTLSGSGNILVEDFMNQNKLRLETKGSGDISLNKFEGIDQLDILMTGSGKLTAKQDIASLKDLNITCSGSGKYEGFPLSAENSTVKMAGAGNVELTATKTLNVTISGSGNAYYKGHPAITENISGSGKLIDAN